jgi:hypothetical protein
VRTGVRGQAESPDARIACGERSHDGERVIARMIVDDDPLPLDLLQAGDKPFVQPGKIRLLVECRRDDGNQGSPPQARMISAMTRS